jgi:ribosomal protein S18 acetylase RimI-like enzyme
MNKADKEKIVIRSARAEDQVAILRLIGRHRAADEEQAQWTYREFFKMGKRPKDQVFVAEKEGRVVGVSGFWYDDNSDNGVYSLNWTYVDTRLRSTGIGSKLMARVYRELAKKRARKLYVETSSKNTYRDALRFYLNDGFKLEGILRDYYGPGEDQIILGKEIRK